jgi:ABC-2 type transport system ATP-binding protein
MIEVEDLTQYYGTERALAEVSFTIEERAVVGFLGLNGAGKSTLLQIVSGLLMPSTGRVVVDGVDAVDSPDILRGIIGYLPEDPPLYDDMRVRDFLLWCGQLKGRPEKAVRERLSAVADICGITDVIDHLIGTLSHGYRKRVGIAQAIIHEPNIVVLDEPISGLDPVQMVEMRDVLRRLREDCTVLVSSHILAEISQTCDRILVLHDGRLVADGTEEELARTLGAGPRLRFELDGPPDTVGEILDDQSDVAEWTEETIEGHSGTYLVRMEEDVRERLVEAFVEAGIGLRRLQEAENELERAFLGVTGEAGLESATGPSGGLPAATREEQ